MRNLWLMAAHEYRRLARRRTFLLSTLGFPLLIGLLMAFGFFMAQRNSESTIGYVDQAGILDPATQPADMETTILAFATEAEATAALEAGEVSAVYVLPANYLESHQATLLYQEDAPGAGARNSFGRFIRANLVTDLPEDVQQRVMEGAELTVRAADGSRSIGQGDVVGFLLPFAAAMLFIFAVMTSAGYLLQVVAEEKENRTMEILVTSMRPVEMIAGKALGLMGLALTQIGIWTATIVVGLVIGSQFWEPLQAIRVPWTFAGLIVLFFLPSYALVAGLMTAIGGAVTEVRQGQQVAGILNLLFVAPLFVLPVLMAAPNSPLSIGLTLFPTTAFVTVAMRWSFSLVPLWQLAASWIILLLTALLSLWASARIFRAGMLRYGQPLSLRAALATLGVGR